MDTVTEEQWRAWDAFHAMRRQLDRALDQSLQEGVSLSAAEYETLIALGRTPDRRLRVTELARAMGWEKSRVSHLIGRMEKRGLIARRSCATDARGAWVVATFDGRRAALRAMRGHNRALQDCVFEVLSDEETAELGRLSSKMLAALDRARTIPTETGLRSEEQ
jgi:DNA-binding MarR family transcriptional regulator